MVTHGGVVATSAAYGFPAGYMSALADENKQRIAGFMVDLATVLGFNGALGQAEDQDHGAAVFSATRSRARSAAPITPAFSPMLAHNSFGRR